MTNESETMHTSRTRQSHSALNARGWIRLAAVLASVTLAGCASSIAGVTKGVLDKVFEKIPTQVELQFKASAGINPDPSGRPSPLLVRFYGLSSLGKFETADFFELYDDDEALLGNALELREEFSFAPGERQTIERQLNENTRYIAVIGAYRDIGGTQWRTSIEIEPHETARLDVLLEDSGISLVPTQK